MRPLLWLAVLALCSVRAREGGTCPAGELDCTGGAGGLCCPPAHPWPEGQREATCCGGGCCSAQQTCSEISELDAACCSDQLTRPCPAIGNYPARCCGRWTVCCAVGTVGCCDPAQPWQADSAAARTARLSSSSATRQPHAAASTPLAESSALKAATFARLEASTTRAEGSSVVYALLLQIAQLSVHTIASGKLVNTAAVRGYENYGASTRPWAYSRATKSFVTVEANFTEAPPTLGGPGRTLTLWMIDARTGVASSCRVSGATGQPSGYCALDGGASMLLGLLDERETANDLHSVRTPATARFVKLDVRTGTATELSSLPRGKDESSAAYYSSYFYACTRDGSVAVRIGPRAASIGKDSGVGLTYLGSEPAASFEPLKWAAGGPPLTLQTEAAGSFLSLAQQRRGLALLRWNSAGGGTPTVVAKLDANTAVPELPLLGPLGYTLDSLSDDGAMYVALVSEELLPGFGRWAIVTIELELGKVVMHSLTPMQLVATVSVSGLGIDHS
ncbi:hypothetical protein T492DRAFT_956916 [Pavlovales sp. CCMP2436]|nr:hypothetical protein T492DRAFT_956916 [Pavlovales sp. CCMP2436]